MHNSCKLVGLQQAPMMIRAPGWELLPQPMAQAAKGTASQGANRPSWQGLQFHKSRTIYTHSYAQTNNNRKISMIFPLVSCCVVVLINLAVLKSD